MTISERIDEITPTSEWVIVLRPFPGEYEYEVGEILDVSDWRPSAVRGLVESRFLKPYPFGLAVPEPDEVVDGRAIRRFQEHKVRLATPKTKAKPKLTAVDRGASD